MSLVLKLIVALGIFQCHAYDDVELWTYIDTIDNYHVATLGNPTPLLFYIDNTRITIIITSGLNGNGKGPFITATVTTMLDIGYNVIYLNWSKYSKLYSIPVIPTILIAQKRLAVFYLVKNDTKLALVAINLAVMRSHSERGVKKLPPLPPAPSGVGAADSRAFSTLVHPRNICAKAHPLIRKILVLAYNKRTITGAPSYIAAVLNAEAIGCKFGKVLVDLIAAGLDGSKVYLLGHSLGAHLLGEVGRCAQQCGFTVPRITGLDPSGPGYQALSFKALDSTCAIFVDIVHADTGNYGTNTSTGTVDIYPNFSYNGAPQPGCPVGNFAFFSNDSLCSHNRAWMFYCEGARYPTNLAAIGAANFANWQAGITTNVITYIGPVVNMKARGIFWLKTNAQSPFGQKMAGTVP